MHGKRRIKSKTNISIKAVKFIKIENSIRVKKIADSKWCTAKIEARLSK